MTEAQGVADVDARAGVWVLRLDAVQRSVRRLIGRSTHAFYPGYLHLRQQAARAGSLSHIQAEWSRLGHLLEVPGAPKRKPYLKPFNTPANRADQFYWWNSNIPGSYAPSSLRAGQGPLEVVSVNADGTYNLPPDHAERAVRHLLNRAPLPAADVAVFLLRDHGIVAPVEPTVDDLVDVFRREFGVVDDDEFATVYHWGDEVAGRWFEPFAERGVGSG
ncbi:MAG: hypothetical protein QOE45_1506 [Frankiaceae bacterium]|nr:hypothetical protein [Frankiaceae bacterium]